ncbi:MAG: hypothetical protein ACREE3_13665 [Stellaceae bacterium]
MMRAVCGAILIVTNPTKRFGDAAAVEFIDFALFRGVTAALLGGSGAGKTTTIAMQMGE